MREAHNMKEFKPYSLLNTFKKFHYPFMPISFEPIDPLKGNIDAEAEAASMSCSFLMLHGIFMLCWYCIVFAGFQPDCRRQEQIRQTGIIPAPRPQAAKHTVSDSVPQ